MCGSVALDLLQLALEWGNYPFKEGHSYRSAAISISVCYWFGYSLLRVSMSVPILVCDCPCDNQAYVALS